MKKICTRFFIILILAFLSVNSLGAVMPTKPVDTSTEVYLGVDRSASKSARTA